MFQEPTVRLTSMSVRAPPAGTAELVTTRPGSSNVTVQSPGPANNAKKLLGIAALTLAKPRSLYVSSRFIFKY